MSKKPRPWMIGLWPTLKDQFREAQNPEDNAIRSPRNIPAYKDQFREVNPGVDDGIPSPTGVPFAEATPVSDSVVQRQQDAAAWTPRNNSVVQREQNAVALEQERLRLKRESYQLVARVILGVSVIVAIVVSVALATGGRSAPIPDLQSTSRPPISRGTSSRPTISPKNMLPVSISPTLDSTDAPNIPPSEIPSLTGAPVIVLAESPDVSPKGDPPTRLPSVMPLGVVPFTSSSLEEERSGPQSVAAPTGAPAITSATFPVISPNPAPIMFPTRQPTRPVVQPTHPPSVSPTRQPVVTPTRRPVVQPTIPPTVSPTRQPIVTPTRRPVVQPTIPPTVSPTRRPVADPTRQPVVQPTLPPTVSPTRQPVVDPTPRPTHPPTVSPSMKPIMDPTLRPVAPPTHSPTVSPSRQLVVTPTPRPVPQAPGPDLRASTILSYINSVTLSNVPLSYPSQATPQERAVRWLIEDDLVTDMSDLLSLRQRFALATMWFANGPYNSRHTFTWLSSTDECDWASVWDCVNGEVARLWLGTDGLSGTIPADVGLLTALTYLTLDQNQMTGLIPSEIGLLTDLTFLHLNHNQFIGTIPSQILALSSLTNFFLYRNDVTGRMPFCDSDSSRFTHLYADCFKVDCPCCTHCCPDGATSVTQCMAN